jgi:hypothetical protein
MLTEETHLRGFDADTGKELWQQDGAGAGFSSSPACWQIGGKGYLITNIGRLCCVDPHNGRLIWSSDAVSCNATPVVVGDLVVVGSLVAAYHLTLEKAEKLWTTKIAAVHSSPLIDHDSIYIWGSGTFYCLELATGRVRWEHPCKGEYSSPVLADEKILLINENGSHLRLFQASSNACTELSDARLHITECTSPAISQGRLYVRLHDSMGCFNLTPTPAPQAPRPPDAPAELVPGVQYAYYHNVSAMTTAELIGLRPTETGFLPNFTFTPRQLPKQYTIKFTGYLEVPRDGDYTFTTRSQGGSQLYIGETRVVDNDGMHPPDEISGVIALQAGRHACTVLYCQYGGNGSLHVRYEGPGIPKGPIPDAVLSQPR